MIHASVPRARAFSRRWLPPLAAALLACSSGHGSSGTAPTLANLSLWPQTAGLNEGGGSVTVSVDVFITDPDADVARFEATVLDGTGAQVDHLETPLTNPPGVTTGELGVPISAIPTTAITTYTIRVQVFDAKGNASNVLSDTFSVVPGNPVPTITSLSPETAPAGGAGLTLTVTGTGFVTGSTVLWSGSYL